MTTSPEPGPSASRPTLRDLADPVHFFALGFGAGLAPFAPGTFGSVVGLAIALVLAPLGFGWNLLACIVAVAAGIWVCGESARRLGVHDHPAIVWDEVVGMALTLLAVPLAWPHYLAGFALFRAFDILKPWPVGALDRQVGGGLGVMLDDLAAGLLAGATLQLAMQAGVLAV
jgi:phosphatidylglycerophosphatase A